MKLIFDSKKCDPLKIDNDTWAYSTRSGRTLEIIRQELNSSYIEIANKRIKPFIDQKKLVEVSS